MRLHISNNTTRRLRRVATFAAWATTLLATSVMFGGPIGSGSGPTGAIFTTTPDGGIVNENVRYEDKREVYLDGGPKQNAPASAAGLDRGCYVFQITDPPGKLLLSEDPAKCRVVYVSGPSDAGAGTKGGVITELVPPEELLQTCGVANRDNTYTVGNGKNAAVFDCHVADEPNPNDPAGPDDFGPSGRHDTNVDVDHGFPDPEGAIVVQMMPYGTTPNPGGVYKAWMTPIDAYEDLGGDLDAVPEKIKGKVRPHACPDFCAKADPGFGKPNARTKTDNFKVVGCPDSMLHVRKFKDENYNGVWDDGEPEIGSDICVDGLGVVTDCGDGGGWPVDITEPNGWTQLYYTPASVLAYAGTWMVSEYVLPDWIHSTTYLDGQNLGMVNPVDVVFMNDCEEEHEVIFGNSCTANLGGQKWIDANANAVRDPGEGCPGTCEPDVNAPGCIGVTIRLTGVDGMGNPVDRTTLTGPDGRYLFEDLAPGNYTVTVVEPAGFTCHKPQDTPLTCGGPDPEPCEYQVEVFDCMDDVLDLDFADYSDPEIRGRKTKVDTCVDNGSEEGHPDVKVILTGKDNRGCDVYRETYTCGGQMNPDCMGEPVGSFWFLDLTPGTDYKIDEEVPPGYQLIENTCEVEFDLCSDEVRNDCKLRNGTCEGLTPGYWGNWRNHYTAEQFCDLLAGTISDVVGDCDDKIADADYTLSSIGCDGDDATHCHNRFLLSDQLTINLSNSTDPELFNPLSGSLCGGCELPGYGDLQSCLDKGIAIHDADGAGYSRQEILDNKNCLAAFAEL